jgi:energy-coupling factor transport system ATP-binding protein
MKKLVLNNGETNNEFINILNLNFSYRKKSVFNNLNLSLGNNVITSIIGGNGSGKTTLTKIICGMLKPDCGDVFINSCNIEMLNLSDIGKTIGYLFQDPQKQIFGESVIDELSFAMKFNGVEEEIINKRVEKMLYKFDLKDIENQKCHFLSQGEKQRLALATICLNNPKYLILDEPTTSLDDKRKEILFNFLESLNQEGIGILMVSHDLDFVNRLSERIIVIENGQVIEDEYCNRKK